MKSVSNVLRPPIKRKSTMSPITKPMINPTPTNITKMNIQTIPNRRNRIENAIPCRKYLTNLDGHENSCSSSMASHKTSVQPALSTFCQLSFHPSVCRMVKLCFMIGILRSDSYPSLSPSKKPPMKLAAKGNSEITPTTHENTELPKPIRLERALHSEL